jgi:hypothetical protein
VEGKRKLNGKAAPQRLVHDFSRGGALRKQTHLRRKRGLKL